MPQTVLYEKTWAGRKYAQVCSIVTAATLSLLSYAQTRCDHKANQSTNDRDYLHFAVPEDRTLAPPGDRYSVWETLE